MATIVVKYDDTQVAALAADLRAAPARAQLAFRSAVKETARDIRDEWRSNARATARRHGKHYPRTITDEMKGPFSAEVGPEFGPMQGGMGRGFEFGSVNQPPHLDGNRAADGAEGPFMAKLARAAIGAIR